ncbi:MAG: GntR family transcriptional regulator [Hyphomicrobiales bacterium]
MIETRTEKVYRKLRSDILGGQIEPGSQLPFARLKADYGASMGVLREALMRLTAEGLTVSQSQLGFKVMPLSLDDLVDLTESRCSIESLVLKDAIRNGDLDWEARLVAAHHRMERTVKHDPGDASPVTNDWAQAHHAFHMALLSAARNKRLQAIAETLRGAAEVYRRWSMPLEVEKRDVSAEHQELVDLALKRDADGAADALVKHLQRTKDIILHGVKSRV